MSDAPIAPLQACAAGHAEPAAQQRRSIAFIAQVPGRRHRHCTPTAVGLAGRRRRSAFGTINLAQNLTAFQVALQIARGEVTVVDILRQIHGNQLVEPALALGVIAELFLQLATGEETFRSLAGGKCVSVLVGIETNCILF